jgi:methionine sulfoxide reductase heme-binding subunit
VGSLGLWVYVVRNRLNHRYPETQSIHREYELLICVLASCPFLQPIRFLYFTLPGRVRRVSFISQRCYFSLPDKSSDFDANLHDYRLSPCYDVGAMTKKLLRHPFQIVTILIATSLLWAALTYGQSIEAAQAFTRFTARISLLIFAVVFSASALHKIFRNQYTAELLRNRRYFGISFAYSHTVHLLAIIIFLRLSGDEAPMLSVVFGGFAYLLTYAMAFTSNDWSVKKLGAKSWKALHKTGTFYIWFIFFITYLRRLLPAKSGDPIPGGSKAEFVIAFLVVLAILSLRIIAAVASRAGRQAKGASNSEAVS